MSEVWQTIEQAAVTLGLSVRTVNRHITAGKLQSRLFDGRREVLIALPEQPPTPERTSPIGASATGGRGEDPVASAAPSSGAFATGVPDGVPHNLSEDGRESFRQTVSTHVAADKPMDVQTMLALADSIDDKATLAVAAYQTLARSSETQVQSLRRVAFGAWAVVSAMAVGIIVAVGWATHRLTNAEATARYLDQKVVDQKSAMEREVDRLAAERDQTREELQTVKRQADQMRDDLNKRVMDSAAQVRVNAAEVAHFVAAAQQLHAVRPTTAPTAGSSTPSPGGALTVNPSAPQAPTTQTPATQPSASASPSGVLPAGVSPTGSSVSGASPVAAPPTTRPAEANTGGQYMFNSAASRPIAPVGGRVPTPVNSAEAFGPR